MKRHTRRFWILVSIVSISGFSQGMLLPLIAVIFENNGVSSFLNGLNSTGLYIGILFISPFMEIPLRKFGYKPILMTGGLLVLIAMALFPTWQNFWFWFVLRLIVGIGDNALNFAAQTWITEFSPTNKRGRNIAIYGLFFGLGFAVAPLMVPLVHISESLPFILTSILSFIGWLFLFLLHNELPEQDLEMTSLRETFQRFSNVWKYAWVAFLTPFAYGFLETSLNASFPVYALRIGMDLTSVSTLLVVFSIGTIAFQLPLGIIGDKIGRNRTITGALLIGCICFSFAGMLDDYYLGSLIFIFIAGMFVGSMFSLGISYMADLTPKNLLPTGNILCGIFFSIGSLIGPSLGGLFIQAFPTISFFYLLSGLLLIILIVTFKRNILTPTLR